ncbi:MAG: enoyl-CoA hydratase/isomerase family protein [Candidatus Hodarchaeales archaeon]
MPDTILYSKEGSFLSPVKNIALLKLNRPDALNSINADLVTDLNAALDKAVEDPDIRCVVITAEGEKVFCTGADLKAAQSLTDDPEGARELIAAGQELFRKIENLPKPTIAAVNALALGGGLEMTLACDIRIVSEGAKLGCPEVALGLLPAWGGTQRLAKIVGMGKAKELILTGGQVTAKEALEIGLANKVTKPDELMSTAMFVAAKIAGNAPIAVQEAKKCLNMNYAVDIETGNKAELESCITCFKTEDIKEGIKAVFEKRKAKFSGK